MDARIEYAIDLLRNAGACFPDSFAALNGAKVVADALDPPKKKRYLRRTKHPSFRNCRVENWHIRGFGRVSAPRSRLGFRPSLFDALRGEPGPRGAPVA